MPLWPEFVGPAYKLDFNTSGPSDTINWFLEAIEKGPRQGQMRLRQCPGLPLFTTIPTSPIRAMWAGGGRLFVIGGSQLYEVYQDGFVSPTLGSVGNGTNPAIIVSNGFELAIASAGLGYVTDGAAIAIPGHAADASVRPIIDTQGQPLQSATMAFMDQYFIAAIQNSKQIRISNLAPAGAVWDPGDASIKEAYSDNIQRVWVDDPGGELLVIFGAETQEIWQDTGGLFPFTRINGAVYPIGCDSAWSVAGKNGQRFWLWNGMVWSQTGTSFPQRISDYGVEQAIKGIPQQNIPGYTYFDQANCEGDCYLQGGHMFYMLSFPEAGVTWVYDAATQNWHKRLYWNNNIWNRYRPRLFAQQWSMILGGDYQSGKIFVLDPNTYTDADGVPLRRDRIATYITDQNRNMRYNRLTLDIATGVGLNVGVGQPGYDPQIGMRYSNNRGNNYSNWRNGSLGKAGDYDRRVFWTQMGSARIGMSIHTSITDPIDTSINAAYVDLGKGTMAARP